MHVIQTVETGHISQTQGYSGITTEKKIYML